MMLSVLMPCLTSRPWEKMLAQLQKQIGSRTDVEIITDLDNGESSSGLKRQRLIRRACGDYICFVDDDDRLSDQWLERLLEGIALGPDVVSFDCRCNFDGKKETWSFRLQQNDRRNGIMGVNHLCPMRREIALKVGWCPDLGYGDDQLWVQPLIASGLLRVEYHIEDSLYFYQYSSRTTANQTSPRKAFAREYVGNGLRCFKTVNGGILIECPSRTSREGYVAVRDSENNLREAALANLTLFHIARIV